MTNQFSTEALLYPLTKGGPGSGAQAGHGFNGNQWTDKASAAADEHRANTMLEGSAALNARKAACLEMAQHHQTEMVAARVRGDQTGEKLHGDAARSWRIAAGRAQASKQISPDHLHSDTAVRAAPLTQAAEQYNYDNNTPPAGDTLRASYAARNGK